MRVRQCGLHARLALLRAAARHTDPIIFLRSCFETLSLPALLRRYPRGFTFYLANPIRSIPDFNYASTAW
jgi:hypothetical protein